MPNLTEEKNKNSSNSTLSWGLIWVLEPPAAKMCALEIEAEAPDLEPHCSHSSELCIAIVITEGLR